MLVTQKESVRKSYDRYNNNLTREVGLYGTDTGHHDINLIIGGHVPTKITSIGGRSGHGKSALVVQMCEAAAKGERLSEILMYSWEMEASYMADRYVCYKVGITLPELRYSRILPQTIKDKIREAYKEASTFPVSYHHYSTNIENVLKTNETFLEGVRKKEMISGKKIQPVMILDFVGMTTGGAKYGNRTYDIGDFMQKLKQNLNDTGMSAIILAQINRTADHKDYPDVTDFSDSQFIEQNSDTVMILDRPEYRRKENIKDPETGGDIPSKGLAMIRVVKNREGQVKDVLVRCDISKFRFWNRDMVFGQDYRSLYNDEMFWKRLYQLQ